MAAASSLLAFDVSLMLPRLQQIINIIIAFPGAYLPIVGAWVVTAIYFIIHPGEHPGYTYAMSTGIALAFTAISVIFKAVATYSVDYGTTGFYLMVGLIIYGVILIILGITHIIPELVADFLGDPGHVVIPKLIALFYVDGRVPIDLTTIVVLVIPVLGLIILKYVRQATGAS
jgi:hypothetical protein